MKEISRDELKKFSLRRFLLTWKYSFEGLKYAYTQEQSMLTHLGITAMAVCMGFYFNISGVEWMFIITFLGFIVSTELINTAIEAAVDFTSIKIHPLAKIAKDCGSAATLMAVLTGISGAVIIFSPKIVEKLF